MTALAQAVNGVLRRAGLRIRRDRPENRFDAMAETLAGLATRGFDPAVVVDGGANVGTWSRLAAHVFPRATLHAIEPQTECGTALGALARDCDRVIMHQVAITAPGHERVRLGDAIGRSTGARVLRPGEIASSETCVSAHTLDELILPSLPVNGRVLLKLDVEGHEIEALSGAEGLLPFVDVLVTEVQFYEVERNGHPTFLDVLQYVGDHGLLFYDVAALASRRRDGRLRIGDVVFVRSGSMLDEDRSWA